MEIVAAALRERRWTQVHTFLLLAIIAAVTAVGILLPREVGRAGGHDETRLGAWLVIAALLTAFGSIAAHGVTGLWRGAFVDRRNKVSLARLQMVMWTVLVLSAYLAAALANVGMGDLNPLDVAIPGELLVAMGISAGSLVVSPMAQRDKRSKKASAEDQARARAAAARHGVDPSAVDTTGQIVRYDGLRDSRWMNLVMGDEVSNHCQVDLSKLQLLFFTIVLVLAYGVAIGDSFSGAGNAVHALPTVNEAMVVLLGISHAGYLTKKAIPQ